MTGVSQALQAGSVVTAGGTTLADITLDDLHECVGRALMADGFNGRWYMSHYVYHTAVLPLLTALGGTDIRHVEAGGDEMLLGFPVTFTQVLPGQSATNGNMVIVFGDLGLGMAYGVRRQANFRILNELYAASDQVAIQSTLRRDIVTHSVGDATDAGVITCIKLAAAVTAANRQAKK